MTLNLVQHRDASSIWDGSGGVMAFDLERWLAAVLGGTLLVSGFRRRTVGGLWLVLGGAGLTWWAATDTDRRRRRRARLIAVWPQRTHTSDDRVGEASEDSFPASDAPAWTPTTGSTAPSPEETRNRV
jgi:hypothetical protein